MVMSYLRLSQIILLQTVQFIYMDKWRFAYILREYKIKRVLHIRPNLEEPSKIFKSYWVQ